MTDELILAESLQEHHEVICFTASQVGELCQVTVETVRSWLNHGKLKGIQLDGGYWRIRKTDLIEFLNERYPS